jgi:hypothetical protein
MPHPTVGKLLQAIVVNVLDYAHTRLSEIQVDAACWPDVVHDLLLALAAVTAARASVAGALRKRGDAIHRGNIKQCSAPTWCYEVYREPCRHASRALSRMMRTPHMY